MFIDPRVTLAACNLKPTDSVADFGAGSGFVAHAAALLVPQGNVFAIELNKDMLTRITRDADDNHITNLHPLWGDVEIPGGSTLKDGSVDAVIMSNILFQLDDRAGAVRESFRVLKSGGRLIVIDWKESFGGLGPKPEAVVTPDVVTALATKTGFTAVSGAQPGGPTAIIPTGEHHYALLFQKP